MDHHIKDSHLLQNVLKSIDKAAEVTGASKNSIERLKSPKRSIVLSVPVKLDNGDLKVFKGYRVQHNQTLGPFKGGLRFHPSVNLSESTGLATLMTFKNSLLNLPLGGAKGGVCVAPETLSNNELEQLTRRFASELSPFIGPDKDIPAPDVGTSSQSMAWMMDTYSNGTGFAQTGVVTGKPVEVGGSLGRDSATGLGVVLIVEKILEKQNKQIKDVKIAIQGFGKVGLHAANEAYKLGGKIVAVSDVSGGFYHPDGLNIPYLIEHVEKNGTLAGCENATQISNEDLLELDVDILSPCALDGVINSSNVEKIKAKIIVEGANGPVTANANEYLHQNGHMIVPDILANGGGVVVSYFEWVQDIIWLYWEEEEVRSKLKQIMYKSFDQVWIYMQGKKVDMRTAAMSVALIRLEVAMKLRGQAW